ARPQIGAVQRPAGADARMVGAELAAEIESLLAVGLARGELAAEREPAAPGDATQRHGDRRLLRLGQGEKAATRGIEAAEAVLGDTVAAHIEEAAIAAGPVDRPRDILARFAIGGGVQRRHVDHRQGRGGGHDSPSRNGRTANGCGARWVPERPGLRLEDQRPESPGLAVGTVIALAPSLATL